jgi:hypothetical protein
MTEKSAATSADVRLRYVPLRLVLFGMAMFWIGTVLLLLWADTLARPDLYGSFHALALTHVFALGFVTSLIIAVLYQFIPAAFHANVRGLRRAQAVAGGYSLAVVIFAVSLGTGALVLAAVAGPLLAVTIAVFLSQMADVIHRRAKRWAAESGFHVLAFLSLTAVILLGSLLATSLPTAWMGPPQRWLEAKIVLAVAGWVGMILFGVSYHTVRGLNGSPRHPRMAALTLWFAGVSVTATPLLLLFAAPAWLCSVAMAALVVAACVWAVDVVYIVRGRAATSAGVTWRGHLLMAALVVISALEGVVAVGDGSVWGAMAVTGVLLGVAPVAILANGNRIVPILIANRFAGRGRAPLSAGRLGRITMPAAVTSALLAWGALQAGIGTEQVGLIRLGACLLLAAASCLAVTVGWRVGEAWRASRHPLWEVR